MWQGRDDPRLGTPEAEAFVEPRPGDRPARHAVAGRQHASARRVDLSKIPVAFQTDAAKGLLHGIGHGLGYSAILIAVADARELLGSGRLNGAVVLPLSTEGGWYVSNGLMLLPPSAFFLIGLYIWALRTWKKDQVEKD